jgi:hypothetical protein
MTSQISTAIKKREQPNDKFYTPDAAVKTHIDFIKDLIGDGICYEPFAGLGAYLSHLPPNTVWTELDNGKDFFDFNEKVEYIVSNPPYSCIDKVLEHSVELNPSMISYLIGVNNLTARRLEYMNKHGYYLERVKMLKIYKWYGMSFICVWVKGSGADCIQYDRVVYK